MKKTLALLLAALMLVSTLVACGDADDGNTPTTTAAPTVTTAPTAETTVPEETKPVANLPADLDFKGYTFNIANGFHTATKYTTNAIAPTEITGDVLNDAMYRRTLKVEESLKIDVVDLDISQSKMKTSLQANAGEFDLMTVDLSGVRGFINSGYMLDFNEMPNIDLSMPWWDQNAQEKLSVQGKLYHTFSDFLITQLDNGRGMFFNKKMHTDLGLESIYDLVRAGTWTLDKMREMGLQAVADLDGNQVMDSNDRYGMSFWTSATSFYEIYLTSSEAEIMKQGPNGVPYFYCYEQNFIDVCQRLLKIFDTDDFLIFGESDLKIFKEDKSLFASWTLYGATLLRDMQNDFGVIPFPKYDEAQESYWHVSPNPHALMLPNHIDQERTGYILEALAYYSSAEYAGEQSLPYAYFDTTLKGKASRDADSFEMFDIIKNTISYIIKFDDSPMTGAIYGVFDAGQADRFASIIATTRKMADKKLAQAFENMGVTE